METVMLLMIVVSAFLAMFLYFKGALQGNYKTNADAFSPKQYGGREIESNEKSINGPVDTNGAGITYTNTVLGVSLNGDKIPEVTYDKLQNFPKDGETPIKQVDHWGTYSK